MKEEEGVGLRPAPPSSGLKQRCSIALEDQLQAELDGAWTARSEHRVARVWRCSGRAEISACFRIDAAGCKVGPVENIEELRPELGGVPFPELPVFSHGEIHIVIIRAAHLVAAIVTNRSVGGRSENAPTTHVAAEIRE
jgi:hypothetical protein